MTQQELSKTLLADESFRAEFKTDPKGVMRAHGMDVPDDVEIEVIESTATKQYVVLPPLRAGELDGNDLDAVTGGELGRETTIIFGASDQ